MPSEKWTPRFGERVSFGGRMGVFIAARQYDGGTDWSHVAVVFPHLDMSKMFFSMVETLYLRLEDLEPAPDPAVAALDIPEPKNAQWYRDRIKWGSYYGEPNDVFSILQSAADKENMLGIAWAIIEAANKLAAKGGAE